MRRKVEYPDLANTKFLGFGFYYDSNKKKISTKTASRFDSEIPKETTTANETKLEYLPR